MVVSRLPGLEEYTNGLQVRVGWKRLESDKDVLDYLGQVYYNMKQPLNKLLLHKSI